MSGEDELVRAVQAAIDKQRPYAGFFDWHERDIAEWGAANLFTEAASTEPGYPFGDVRDRGQGNDPPDCETVDCDGRRIALEVTELVDPKAVAAAKAGKLRSWATWDAEKILSTLTERIASKDSRTLKGGPYDEYFVLIHTDEPALRVDDVKAAVANHTFVAKQITRVYLLWSYAPGHGYPYVRLL